ncbi:DUF3710 domain-containing protein [Acaricomes phytoseiuli]|uniref:DUF3710 domain-containing protein n=1 Tax=Acaricomes phytoseiuli TaxID=291968 RepID=UPI0003A8C91E|nr:DUF3710 domain-containing protein [Acaricomes phytoseiuli]MCW1249127.1 DUF3710 domain-containing protein [Acaricomes phytoseiuli]
MAFGRRKRQATKDHSVAHSERQEQDSPSAYESAGLIDLSALPDPADTAYERSSHGPFDVDEVSAVTAFLDLGALRIAPHERLQLRLEIEESTQRVIAVTLDLDGSSLQLQAFAAPRSEGLWLEIQEQISQSVAAQGGSTEGLEGTFGTEILAKLPAQAMDGSAGYRVARFIGVDGPRWFLRGVLGGPAAVDREAAAELERLFRSTVVVRDDTPMPPRDLLPLRLPKDAVAGGASGEAPESEESEEKQKPGFEPPRRGPEIT